jgi:hypothetical protein
MRDNRAMHQKVGALINVGESEAHIQSGQQCEQADNRLHRRSSAKPDGHLSVVMIDELERI